MKLYFRYFGLLILLLLSSCKSNNDNIDFIKKLSTVTNGLPSPYFNYYLYFELEDGDLLETNIDLVHELYKDYYQHQYKDFNVYLEDLFNKKLLLKSMDLAKYNRQDYFFTINKFDNEIDKMNISNIQKKYLISEKQSYILPLKKYKPTQLRTILYKMFSHGYLINFNDYSGYYYISKYRENDFK
ncbi:hypothetical protein ATE47_12385 [Chryseobacterium sp. IHB B 17019]|uniref:hypothetical protein n=1 Tax=Chryseobacterium sp. IHB B 17019 TaxID=1721091 RepID=UPI000721DE6B|nr:hypothetical protein [Chryseobacterium sp. IHB B 17019]ALR31270.1 hypothetical protein ATE47_12385 [Chryseobacterium sp. IHB B 17019]